MNKINDINPKKNKKMPCWGISPKMLLILSPFIFLFIILNFLYYPLFLISINYIYLVVLGMILILIGFFIYFKSIFLIKKAYNASELVTKGIYGYMRHPLYSSFILFFTPGITCFFKSWLMFIIPIIYYIIFRLLIKKEEDYCLEKFGENYTHYKKNVFAIIPKLRKYRPIS